MQKYSKIIQNTSFFFFATDMYKNSEVGKDKHYHKEDKTIVTETVHTIVPPDGGYGWVIVASSVFLSFTTTAAISTIGIFMVEWIEYFHSSKVAVSWVGFTFVAVRMVIGNDKFPLFKLIVKSK